jgi:hypothetical protein
VPVSRLVTCLSLLPNMHTLRLEIRDAGEWDAFSNATFPQVRTLVIVAPDAKYLVPCCPQVRAVIARDRDRELSSDDLLDLFDESGHILEKLEGFIPSPASVQCEFLCRVTLFLFPLGFQCLCAYTHVQYPRSRGNRA